MLAIDQVLSSFEKLFFRGAEGAWISAFDTATKIQDSFSVTGSDPVTSFAKRQGLFRAGLDQWLESLTTVTEKMANPLRGIAVSYPGHVEKDAPKWVRSQLQRTLEKTLGFSMSDALSGRKGSPIWVRPKPSHLIWFWTACDDTDFDTFPDLGRPDPWCAPAWCWTNKCRADKETFESWVRTDTPKRLDARQTEKLIRREQRRFAARLTHVLDHIEHEVRIAMAAEGKLVIAGPEQPKSESDKLPPLLRHGKACDTYVDEIKRIRNFFLNGYRVEEVRKDHPQFTIWNALKHLPAEDQDTFDHPVLWGSTVGYAHRVLGKVYGKSPSTISDWIKAYRKRTRSRAQNISL